MSEDSTEAWAYVMVQISIPAQVGDEVINALSAWFGRKYPNTQRNAHGWNREMEPYDDYLTVVRFSVHKRYNPHRVARKVEKKLNKLLAASS